MLMIYVVLELHQLLVDDVLVFTMMVNGVLIPKFLHLVNDVLIVIIIVNGVLVPTLGQ